MVVTYEGYMDPAYPKAGAVIGAHEGSQSESPSKELSEYSNSKANL